MIAIVDYNAGNTCSVINALNRIGAKYVLTADADMILSLEKVILPGVGHAKSAMDNLKKLGLVEVIQSLQQPFLGICVGMQLMGEKSMEGPTEALGIISTEVVRFDFDSKEMKVPHMGWNKLNIKNSHPVFAGIDADSYVYYVHSYYMLDNDNTIATTDYGETFSAAVVRDNFVGLQFHPEKSGAVGQQILRNFVTL